MTRALPRKRFGAAILAATVLAAAPGARLQAAPQTPAPQAQTILPGYWEYKVKLLGATIDTEMWCVREDQIDKFFSGPCNRHHKCVYPTRVVGDGKASFGGYWQNDEGKRANVQAAGEYSPKRFVLRTKATRGTNGAPIPAMTLDAKWLGATCKPGAKTPK